MEENNLKELTGKEILNELCGKELNSKKNILEAIEKVKLINQICTSDKKLINEAKSAKENLTKIKENIEKENNELQKNKEVLEAEIKQLEDDKTKLLDYIKANSNLLDLSTSNIVPITLPSDMSEDAKALITEAQKYLGIPYLWGGTTPAGFDCSGFTYYVFKNKAGITLPRNSAVQSKYGTYVSKSNLKAGDLVFFLDYETMDGIGHCGIYIGNGEFIHASSGSGYCVKISNLLTGSYNTRYATARRLI